LTEKDTSLIAITLTEAEALGLLNLCLMSQEEHNPVQERALMKLSQLVRSFLATAPEAPSVSTDPAQPSSSKL